MHMYYCYPSKYIHVPVKCLMLSLVKVIRHTNIVEIKGPLNSQRFAVSIVKYVCTTGKFHVDPLANSHLLTIYI